MELFSPAFAVSELARGHVVALSKSDDMGGCGIAALDRANNQTMYY
jgi:hypothetical protein